MKRASYRYAIKWIAFNDDPGSRDALLVDSVRLMVSVVLTSDLFGKCPRQVAMDVVKARCALKATGET